MLLSFSNPKGNSRGHIPFLLNSVNCWLRCSRMLSLYRAVVNCTELKELSSFIDCLSTSKSSFFSVDRKRFCSSRPTKRSGMWPVIKVSFHGLTKKATWPKSSTLAPRLFISGALTGGRTVYFTCKISISKGIVFNGFSGLECKLCPCYSDVKYGKLL